MIRLDSRDARPIYEQVMDSLRRLVVSGAIQPGEQLPSVRDLALEAGVTPTPMQRALSELEREGLVYSQRTAGRFITDDRQLLQNLSREQADAQVRAMLQAVRALGYDGPAILGLVQRALEETESERKA